MLYWLSKRVGEFICAKERAIMALHENNQFSEESTSSEPTLPVGTTKLLHQRADATKPVGAVVVGGDYQGLGIVRSLGRHEVPICIIDDELSISRFSRYAAHALRVKSLRDERQ